MDSTIGDAHLDEKKSVSLTDDEMEQINGGTCIGPSWMQYHCPNCRYNDFEVKFGAPGHVTIRCLACNTTITM